MAIRLRDPCLLVLVGATASGKSQWADEWFAADQIVSSDRRRAVVAAGEDDLRASADAFEILDLIVAKRMHRGLVTVVDTTGLDPTRRVAWRALAERHDVPAYAVVFDPPAAVVRERARGSGVPSKVVSGQLREVGAVREALADEGFAAVLEPGPVTLVPPAFLSAPEAAARQRDNPRMLEFGLQVSRFDFAGHPATTGLRLPSWRARPRTSAFGACGSWTTSSRSPRSAASGRT